MTEITETEAVTALTPVQDGSFNILILFKTENIHNKQQSFH